MANPEKEKINEGMAFFKEGELGKAELVFREFLKEYPKSDLADNACYNLAKIAMKRQENHRALEWLDFLLQNFPDSDAAYFAKDEKIELMREMGQGPDETDDERYFQGKQSLLKGKLDEAEQIFLSFLKEYADSDLVDNAHYNLAVIAKKRGQLDQVKHHVDIIMTQYPESDAAIYAQELL